MPDPLVRHLGGDYDREARLMYWRAAPASEFTVVSAVGLNTRLIHDVGVAGLDRVLQVRDQLDDAQGRRVASMYQLSSQVWPPSVEKACSQ